MKKIRETVIGIIVVIAIGILVVWVYNNEMDRGRRELARRIASLSPRGGNIPQTIEGLREAIALYEAQIEQHVRDAAQTGAYWRILAIRLSDRDMHRDALHALERAIHYNANDPALFFLTGESASIVAASVMGFTGNSTAERDHYLNLAENAYLRAIQLDAAYQRPLLGLAILYTFDLDRPAEAIPLMERYLQISPNNVHGMFVLARAYFMTENFTRALDIYDRIISTSNDPGIRSEAQNNREIIMDLLYG